MANIVIFSPDQEPKYLTSVNEGDFILDPSKPKDQVATIDSNVIINPDISEVVDVPQKFWKRGIGKKVVQMSTAEKSALLEAEKEVRRIAIDNFDFEGGGLAKFLVEQNLVVKEDMLDAIKEMEGVN